MLLINNLSWEGENIGLNKKINFRVKVWKKAAKILKLLPL